MHLHGAGYRCGSVAKVFGRLQGPRRHNIPILLGPRRYHEYCRLSSPVLDQVKMGFGLNGGTQRREMNQKVVRARSQQERNDRRPWAKTSDRTVPKGDVDDDSQLSPEWIRELKRRVKDSRDPVRYMLVSEFTRKFILYYDVKSDTYAMNDASRGTLFKRREIAESVKTHLGKGVALVKFTVKGNRLTRLSPFRGMRLRSRSASRIRRRTGHAHITHK